MKVFETGAFVGSLETREMDAPPDGALALRVTVPVSFDPPNRLVGDSAIALMTLGIRVKDPDDDD